MYDEITVVVPLREASTFEGALMRYCQQELRAEVYEIAYAFADMKDKKPIQDGGSFWIYYEAFDSFTNQLIPIIADYCEDEGYEYNY